MKPYMNKTIIVKIGTESLVNFNQSEKVEKMVQDIAYLMQHRIHVVLVTSWAVGFGRNVIPKEKNKQVLASVGQPILMNQYAEKFGKYGIAVGQILATHASVEQLVDHEKQFRLITRRLLHSWNLPIINENDALSTVEMRQLKRWSDNDQNAFLVAKTLRASEIIFITNTNGVYRDKTDTNTRISELHWSDITQRWIRDTCGSEKSKAWTGGMQSKLKIWRAFAESGGITHICDGLTTGVYEHVMENESSGGTRIIP